MRKRFGLRTLLIVYIACALFILYTIDYFRARHGLAHSILYAQDVKFWKCYKYSDYEGSNYDVPYDERRYVLDYDYQPPAELRLPDYDEMVITRKGNPIVMYAGTEGRNFYYPVKCWIAIKEFFGIDFGPQSSTYMGVGSSKFFNHK